MLDPILWPVYHTWARSSHRGRLATRRDVSFSAQDEVDFIGERNKRNEWQCTCEHHMFFVKSRTICIGDWCAMPSHLAPDCAPNQLSRHDSAVHTSLSTFPRLPLSRSSPGLRNSYCHRLWRCTYGQRHREQERFGNRTRTRARPHTHSAESRILVTINRSSCCITRNVQI